MISTGTYRSMLPFVGISIATAIVLVTVLSIPLAAGEEMGLSSDELSSWIMVIYGVPGVLGIWLAIRYQQPLPLTGTIFAIIFVASIGDGMRYSELTGAFILAGAVVMVLGALGLTSSLTRWIPPQIVWGLLAGIVLPFITNIFSPLGEETLAVGSALVAYLVSRWWLGASPIVILPALVAGVAAAGLSGQLHFDSGGRLLPAPTFITPDLSLTAVATVVPVVVVLMTIQANIPSAVVIRNHGYSPPIRAIDIVSGLATMLGSFFGPMAASLSLPFASLVTGPDVGPHSTRHRVIYFANGFAVAIAVFAGAAAAVSQIIPLPLLFALAGLAMLGVFTSALQQMVSGNLVLGPAFAFAITLSDITLLGFESIFWALVFGIGVSMLLERPQLRTMRTETDAASDPKHMPEHVPSPESGHPGR